MNEQYPFVRIIWDDAEVNNEWEEVPDEEELEESLVETSGRLVKETPKYYWIASNVSEGHVNARTKVPKSMVKQKFKLKEVEDQWQSF